MENTKELINVTNALIFALKIDGKKDKANTKLIAEAERIVKLFAIPVVTKQSELLKCKECGSEKIDTDFCTYAKCIDCNYTF